MWTRKWVPTSTGGATVLKLFKDASGNIVFTGKLGNSYFVSRLDADATGCGFVDTTLINISNANTTVTNIPFTSVPFTGTTVTEQSSYSFLSYAENMLCGGVGVDEIENDKVFMIYPNPVHGLLDIKSSIELANDSRIEIYNSVGSCVSSGGYQRNGVDVSALANGMYFLRIHTGGKIYSSRFLVEQQN